MRNQVELRSKRSRRTKKAGGRPTIGIRELKARASAIIEDVKNRRTSYAITKRGEVEALIVPVDAGNGWSRRPRRTGPGKRGKHLRIYWPETPRDQTCSQTFKRLIG